jgi:hypothetical protein
MGAGGKYSRLPQLAPFDDLRRRMPALRFRKPERAVGHTEIFEDGIAAAAGCGRFGLGNVTRRKRVITARLDAIRIADAGSGTNTARITCRLTKLET